MKSSRQPLHFTTALVLLSLVLCHSGLAQSGTVNSNDTAKVPWAELSGNASVSAEFYTLSAEQYRPDSNSAERAVWNARRPASLFRLVLSPTINLFGVVSVPFNFVLNSRESNSLSRSFTAPTFSQFISNPLNSFGFGFSPTIGWATAHLGSHTPEYSELTGSSVQLLGVGMMLRPFNSRIGVSTGITQRQTTADVFSNVQGSYSRSMTMAKLGYGKEDGSFVDLNFVKIKDDTTDFVGKQRPFTLGTVRSIDTSGGNLTVKDTIGAVPLPAEEGFVGSVQFKVAIDEGISFRAEGAISGFSRDEYAQQKTFDGVSIPSSVLTLRTSTRIDRAMIAGVSVSKNSWGIDAQAKYLGAGFVPVANPFMQVDRFEVTVAPRVALFDNVLSMNGTVGRRTNNLSGILGSTMSQLIGSFSANVVPFEELSIGLNYSNFGIRNNVANDTLKIENVAQSFGISPTLSLAGEELFHTISLSAALDKFDDFNVVSGALSSNNTTNVFGMYSLSFNSVPLNITVTSNYLTNSNSQFGFVLFGWSAGASYRLFDNSVQPSVTFTRNTTTPEALGSDVSSIVQGSIRWTVTRKLSLQMNTFFNSTTFGSGVKLGKGFNEMTGQLVVSTRL